MEADNYVITDSKTEYIICRFHTQRIDSGQYKATIIQYDDLIKSNGGRVERSILETAFVDETKEGVIQKCLNYMKNTFPDCQLVVS